MSASLNTPKRGTFTVSAICKQGRPFGVRARGVLVPTTETSSREIRASAHSQSAPVTSFVRVIDAILPLRRKLAARTFEALRTRLGAQALAAIFTSYEGPRAGFVNFCRPLVAAGKPSFLRIPFVDHCSEATNSITHAFRFSPVVVGQVHLSQSAPPRGLVRISDTHRDTKRKRSWVTNIGSETT